ncbi:MAG: YcxB family protein [Limnohabitans sp.]|nr:YcxB family protein [Limnohabitans sp.]
MEKDIVINCNYSKEELSKVTKHILLNSKIFKYLFVGLPIIFAINVASSEKTDSFFLDYIFPVLIVIVIWTYIYFRSIHTAKKRIISNSKNFENITLTVNKDSFIQEGQTFKIQNFWKEINKIKETKEWYLIFQNQNSAIPIFKKDLSENQNNDLKELFNSLDIKKSLL